MEHQSSIIGRYNIKEELGRGGCGVVYRAYDPELNRSVALKYVPLTDEAQRERWRREAQMTANLHHPHIVLIYDANHTNEAAYIVMELLGGGTLRQYLTIPRTWPTGVSLLLPLCDALAHAHRQGIIHRDIKPENILFSGNGQIKLVDFGLAYLIGASRLTKVNGMVGTPCYAAPEQIRGQSVDGRADIFALATVLYEMLAGQPLFAGDNYQTIYQKIIQDEPVDLSLLQGIVPPLLLQSLARALAKNPTDRYSTADKFGAALRRCLGQGAMGPDQTLPLPDAPAPLITQPEQQNPIRLEWPIHVPHTPEEDEMLRQLYQDEQPPQSTSGTVNRAINKVVIKEELLGGFGGARVLVVIPVEQTGVHQAARVVKLGPRVMLEAERNNYDNFVREHLPTAVASRKRFADRETMAALEYVFVGGGLLEPVHDLVAYYQKHSAHEIAKTLETLLADHLEQYWYRQGRLVEEHTVVEYGLHLPAQINLALRPNTDDWLQPEDMPTPPSTQVYHPVEVNTLLQSQEPVAPGELVLLQGFEVVRIKPWSATLAHKQERQVRVRVAYEPESGIAQQLHGGQSVVVWGQVLITGHNLLKTVVQMAFDECNEVDIAPNDDYVLTGLGRRIPYPNPLKLYPALLDEMLEGRRSIIHGDLHLRNVLVDRDGRPWLIDFGQVREGHALFDFIKLETYIRQDVLSKASGFTLAEYAQFEEALADAHYGLWAAKMPTNRELRKAFWVIRAIRHLAGRLYPQKTSAETYFRCLLLYNLAILKYARDVVLQIEDNAEEQSRLLQNARLSFITASVQGRWLEKPPRPWPQWSGVLAQLREVLGTWGTKFAKPALYLAIALSLSALLVLGNVAYQFRLQARQAEAENLNSQGAIYLQQGKPEIAADLLREAIQIDPQYPTAHHNLGMAYYVQGDTKGATEQFQMAITLDPSYASPHYELGRVYDDLGRAEEALRHFQRAIKLDPTMSEAYNEIGYILNRQGQYTEAVTILQEGLEQGKETNPPYLLKNLGRAYLGLDKPLQAVKHLEVATARLSYGDALYIEAYRLLAEAYEATGNFDQALETWQGPLRDESDAPEQIQRLSTIIGRATGD